MLRNARDAREFMKLRGRKYVETVRGDAIEREFWDLRKKCRALFKHTHKPLPLKRVALKTELARLLPIRASGCLVPSATFRVTHAVVMTPCCEIPLQSTNQHRKSKAASGS
jgi:hypothetical protein